MKRILIERGEVLFVVNLRTVFFEQLIDALKLRLKLFILLRVVPPFCQFLLDLVLFVFEFGLIFQGALKMSINCFELGINGLDRALGGVAEIEGVKKFAVRHAEKPFDRREQRIATIPLPLQQDLKSAIGTNEAIFGIEAHPNFTAQLVEMLTGLRSIVKAEPLIVAN